jgi:Protein of unknown function (DUF1344)
MFAGSLRAGPEGKVVSMGKILGVFVTVGILSAALEDGSTYKVARGVNINRMKAGEKVTVTTSGFGGTVEASAITPAVD